MKKILAILAFSFSVSFSTGVPLFAARAKYPSIPTKSTAQELDDYFQGLHYAVKTTTATSATSLTVTTTYYGYMSDLSIKCIGADGQVTYWTSFQPSTGTVWVGQSFDMKFDVPVDSPTRINYTVSRGTISITMGGYTEDGDGK